MNISAIFKVYKFNLKDLKLQIPVVLGGFLFGMLTMFITVRFIDIGNYINMGIYFACFMFWMYMIIFIPKSFALDFKHIVKMGICRKNYIIGTTLYYLLSSIVFGIVIHLLTRLEVFIALKLYENIPVAEMLDKVLFENPLVPFIVGLGVLFLGIVFAAVVLKFGIKGFAVIYFGFIIGNLSLSNESVRNTMVNMGNSTALSAVLNADLPIKIFIVSSLVLISLALSIKTMMKIDIA